MKKLSQAWEYEHRPGTAGDAGERRTLADMAGVRRLDQGSW
ncbi:hypothetical protein [Pseudomonas sp. 8Z]|nr:hypothetical protein [Pseudomonas sp. 8Z]